MKAHYGHYVVEEEGITPPASPPRAGPLHNVYNQRINKSIIFLMSTLNSYLFIYLFSSDTGSMSREKINKKQGEAFCIGEGHPKASF
jgi:hypothetical protein